MLFEKKGLPLKQTKDTKPDFFLLSIDDGETYMELPGKERGLYHGCSSGAIEITFCQKKPMGPDQVK